MELKLSTDKELSQRSSVVWQKKKSGALLGSQTARSSGIHSLSFTPTSSTATIALNVLVCYTNPNTILMWVNSVGYSQASGYALVPTLVQIKSVGEDRYEFGYNGQMKVDEVAGVGNHNTALFWEYDPRIGRRWNIDPVDQVSASNYSVLSGNPIWRTDPLGNTDNSYTVDVKAGTITQTDTKGGDKTDYVTYKNDPGSYVGSFKWREGTPDHTEEVPVRNSTNGGNVPGISSITRGPGYRIENHAFDLPCQPVDDPFTALGPGILAGLGKRAIGYAGERMLAARGVGLSEEVGSTFRFGRYTAETLEKPMAMGRYYDNVGAFAKGRFMTDASAVGGNKFAARMGLALRPGWNQMTKVAYWEVQAGTTIYKGKAAMQFPWFGGRTQYFVPAVDNLKRVIPH